jgi:hypothetical protein
VSFENILNKIKSVFFFTIKKIKSVRISYSIPIYKENTSFGVWTFFIATFILHFIQIFYF